ncbi:MAG: ATP-binding cassette domain-containing protein [Mycobacterium sp.]
MTIGTGSRIEQSGIRGVTPVLEIRNAHKHFGSVTALNGVDFELRQRQIVGLLGDNGAGKSTLIKTIMGVHTLDSGEMLIDGQPVVNRSPKEARDRGIEAVFQDLAVFDNLNVVTNLYLGHEIVRRPGGRRFGFLNRKSMMDDAKKRMATLDVHLPGLNETIGLMSGGQRQAVAVARAIAFARRVLILDEPTAALGLREARKVLDMVKRLPEEHGTSVILISHNMEHVMELCDYAFVMRQGKVVGRGNPTPENHQKLVSMIMGASASATANTIQPEGD